MAADSKPADAKALVAEMEALYAQVPEVACKGLCWTTCVDDRVDLSPVETAHILAETGVLVTPRPRGGEPCPALVRGRCSVHSVRPMICRLYGSADGMRCKHGCLPSRWISDREVMRLLTEAMRIGRHPSFVKGAAGFIQDVSADPEVAPLLARFLRGERGEVEKRLIDVIEQRRVAAGFPPRR